MKKPPSTSPYLLIKKNGTSQPGCQIFLACGSQSIMEATSVSCGVGAYYLFNFDYPPEAKGAYLFLQEYLLNDFVKHRPSKYAASLVHYQTVAMKK